MNGYELLMPVDYQGECQKVAFRFSTARETMLRKPILMPPSMIKKVDKIAKRKKVSFANVVREAVNNFNEQDTDDMVMLLGALADTMLATTQNVAEKMAEVEKQLDATHAMLEAQ